MPPSDYSGLGELLDGDTSLGKYSCTITTMRNFGSTSSFRQGKSQYEKLASVEGTMSLGDDWHKFFNDLGKEYVLKLGNGEKYRVFFKDLGPVAQLAINPFDR